MPSRSDRQEGTIHNDADHRLSTCRQQPSFLRGWVMGVPQRASVQLTTGGVMRLTVTSLSSFLRMMP